MIWLHRWGWALALALTSSMSQAQPEHGSGQGKGDSRGPGQGNGQGREKRPTPEPDAEPELAPPAEGLVLADDVLLRPHAQYRARYYHLEGRNFTTGDAVDFIRHRARLGATLTYDGKLGAKVLLQDIRRFGEETNPAGDFSADGFDIQEAYAFARPARGLELRLGRQTANLLNQRLVGGLDWAEQARSFDGARARYDREGLVADVFYALVRDTVPTPGAAPGPVPSGKSHLGFFNLGYQVEPWIFPNVVAVVEGDTAEEAARLTSGAYIEGHAGKGVLFDYWIEGYYQWGQADAPVNLSPRTSAYLFGAHSRVSADYRFKPYLDVDVTVISGDGDQTDQTQGVFTAMHPTGHKFLGQMDFFINFPADTSGRGLLALSPGIGTAGLPVQSRIDFHYFAATEGGQPYGYEVDFLIEWPFWKYASLGAVYGLFVPDELFENSRGNTVEHFAYATANVEY